MVNDLPDCTKTGKYIPAYKKYIIFAGDKIESIWSHYFDENYDKISFLCNKNGFKFIFLRRYFFDPDNINCNSNSECISLFNVPDSKTKFNLTFEKLSTDNPLLGHIVHHLVSYPAIIYYEGYDDEYFHFWEYRLPDVKKNYMTRILVKYINRLNSETEFININENTIRPGMVLTTLRSLDSTIEKLRLFGMPRYVINQAIGMFRQLSHLIITKDNRIILPFFNVEIKLAPLPKAIYFLFLMHPEGIVFKDLSNYKYELFNVYIKISPAENMCNISKSIERLCNPLDNSINEKCSRIKEAFLKYFEEDLASIYYITGNAGEKRFILFDREFVHWNIDMDNPTEDTMDYYCPVITRPQAVINLLGSM